MYMPHFAFFIGRMVSWPEEKVQDGGSKVCRFSIAVERGKNESGDTPTMFIKCVAWGQKSAFVSQYFKKGQPIWVMGKINPYTYQDKNLVDHEEFDIQVVDCGFVPKDMSEQAPQNAYRQQEEQPRPQEQPKEDHGSSRENANQDLYRNGNYQHGGNYNRNQWRGR